MKAFLISFLVLVVSATSAKGVGPLPPLRGTVPVVDHSSAAWSPYFSQAVQDWNAVLSAIPGAPRLEYIRKAEKSCQKVEGKANAIHICTVNHPGYHQAYVKTSYRIGVNVAETPTDVDRLRNVACHELAHPILQLGDAYDTRPGESCLYGRNTSPGSFDVQRANELYADAAKPHRKKRR